MTLSPVHRQRRRKNLTLLGILLGMVALMFALTLVKLGAHA